MYTASWTCQTRTPASRDATGVVADRVQQPAEAGPAQQEQHQRGERHEDQQAVGHEPERDARRRSRTTNGGADDAVATVAVW